MSAPEKSTAELQTTATNVETVETIDPYGRTVRIVDRSVPGETTWSQYSEHRDPSTNTSEFLAEQVTAGVRVVQPSTEMPAELRDSTAAAANATVPSLASRAWENVVETAHSLEEKAAAGMHAIVDEANELLREGSELLASAGHSVQATVQGAAEKTGELAQEGRDKAANAARSAASVAEGVGESIQSGAEKATETVKEGASTAANLAKYGASKTEQKSGESLEAAGARMQAAGASMRKDAEQRLSSPSAEKAAEKVESAKSKVSEQVEATKAKVSEQVNATKSKASEQVEATKSKLSSAAQRARAQAREP